AESPFLFLIYVVGSLAYTPFAIAIIVIAHPLLGIWVLAFVAMSIVLQTVYFATLTAGYRAGDLSLVYPIARATGPLLATVGAIGPVSYVAPARETGILFGTLLGARVLAEGDVRRRLIGASGMVVGVIALALG